MPSRPKRPCRSVGCPALTDSGWCDAHPNEARRQHDLWRGTAASRGYDHKWREWRKRYLLECPLCVDCLDVDIVEPATEVHHILKVAEHPEHQYDRDNCKALCKSCHQRRTQRGE